MRPSIARLKQTHGRDGTPPMPSAFDPNPELECPEIANDEDPYDEYNVAGDSASVSDMVSPMVDAERSVAYGLMLEAVGRATTWRT